MELQPKDVCAVPNGRNSGVFGMGQGRKARRQALHPVAVTHPHLKRRRHVVEHRVARHALVQDSMTILPLIPWRYFPPKLVNQGLHSVAYSQDGKLPLEYTVR